MIRLLFHCTACQRPIHFLIAICSRLLWIQSQAVIGEFKEEYSCSSPLIFFTSMTEYQASKTCVFHLAEKSALVVTYPECFSNAK